MIAYNQAGAARTRVGLALATALLLAACGGKSSESAQTPAAVTTGNAIATEGPSGSADTAGNSVHLPTPGDETGHDAMMNDREMMERHRQEMDHDSMRRGGPGNSGSPMPDAPANQSAPMQDM